MALNVLLGDCKYYKILENSSGSKRVELMATFLFYNIMFLFVMKVVFSFTVPWVPEHVWMPYLVLIFGSSDSKLKVILGGGFRH